MMSASGSKRDKKGVGKVSKTRIKEQVIDYYRNINAQLDDGFEDESMQEIFLSNVFEQLAKDGAEISKHQSSSYMVEKLIKMAGSEQLGLLLDNFMKNFEDVISDRSASYVLQTLLYKITEFLSTDEESPFVNQLYQLGMMLLERSELLSQNHASHVVRSLVEVMSGVEVGQRIVKGRHASKDEGKSYMATHSRFEAFEDVLLALAQLLLPPSDSSAVLDLVLKPHTSALIQTFLLIFKEKKPEFCQMHCRRIVGDLLTPTDDNGLPHLFTNQTGSFFCSLLISVLEKKEFKKLLKSISPKLRELLAHPIANFVVQDVVEHLLNSKQMKKVLDCLKDDMLTLMKDGRAGVVLRLVKAALRFTDIQDDIITILKDQLGFKAGGDIGKLFLCLALAVHRESDLLMDLKKVNDGLRLMTYLQSSIIQKLFEFADSSDVCVGLENLTAKQASCLASSKFGSFLYNAYTRSPNVPVKRKKELAEKMIPIFSVIIFTPGGSQVFDAFWDVMSVPCKVSVLENFAKHESEILGNGKCRFVAYKVHLTDFVHRRQVWDKWIIEENKAKKHARASTLQSEDEPARVPKKKRKL